MRLISKWRDYYDFLIGKYGRDDHLTYDRTEFPPFAHEPSFTASPHSMWGHTDMFTFHICGKKYTILVNGEEVAHTKDEVADMIGGKPLFYDGRRYVAKPEFWENSLEDFIADANGVTEINQKYRSPVLYGSDPKIPILDSFGFYKILPSDEIYTKIIAFLGWLKDNPEAPQVTGDKNKIKAHGFDLKRSFRPKMK